MSHPSALAVALAVAGALTAACGSKGSAPAGDAAAPDAAVDTGVDAAGDAPPDTARDRAVQGSAPDTAPDAPTPMPDAAPAFASSGLPSIASIRPQTLASPTPTMPLTDVALEVTGADYPADVVVLFADRPLATTRMSTERLLATVPAALLAEPGAYAIQVEAGVAGARTRSNLVYLTLPPLAATAPVILGYTPDNGVAGDLIRIVGDNLGGPVTVLGPGGRKAVGGVTQRVAWNGGSLSLTRDAVPVTLPAGWQTGPLVVATAFGVARGPVFWVGSNLTKLPGVARQPSSEYASAPFTGPSATDNDLLTAWYTAIGNCVVAPGCTMGPGTYTLTFSAPQVIARLAVRGLRDQYRGTWDYVRARFELLDAPGDAPLFAGSFLFPAPDRDYDVLLSRPITARIVRFVAEQDQSLGPGLSEIEVFPPDGTPPATPDAGADAPGDGRPPR